MGIGWAGFWAGMGWLAHACLDSYERRKYHPHYWHFGKRCENEPFHRAADKKKTPL